LRGTLPPPGYFQTAAGATGYTVKQSVKEFWPKDCIARCAVVVFFRIELSVLLCTPQQRLPILFNGPDNLRSCSFPWGSLFLILIHGSLGPHKSAPPTASRPVQPFLHSSPVCSTHRQKQTTSASRGRIYAVHVMWTNEGYCTAMMMSAPISTSTYW